ncbi:hypothetical protein PoB_005723700 [Plakobranchus ocellatus]|uniref:Uncharacterized protein n=1 Tax=Plakobranchus ocellatus TaxID=259542 RepID=A0AAV4CGL5_9GAST|nr:hypothetical protein PoB_005723700 [Plakobranchus ocellatus]
MSPPTCKTARPRFDNSAHQQCEKADILLEKKTKSCAEWQPSQEEETEADRNQDGYMPLGKQQKLPQDGVED